MVLEKIIVEILGAPCAGKSSVENRLRELGLDDLNHDVLHVGEAWDYFSPFASCFLELVGKSGAELRERLDLCSKQLKSKKIPVQLLAQINLMYEVQLESLHDLYKFLHLGFLQELDKRQGCNSTELRLLFQRDLLRIQLFLEDWTNYSEHLATRRKIERDQLRIIEGGVLGVLNYLYKYRPDDFADIWKENSIPAPSKLIGLSLPDLVIFMGTICTLPPSVFLPFFYDGIRLDNPEDAVDLDARLEEVLGLFYGSPLMLFLTAEQSVEEKAAKIKVWIKSALVSPRLRPRQVF